MIYNYGFKDDTPSKGLVRGILSVNTCFSRKLPVVLS